MKTIIIGAVAAGMSAAAKLRRLDKDAIIHVYEKGTDISYGGCGMPYFLGSLIEDERLLVARTREDFEKEGIQVFLNHEAITIDPEKKKVSILKLETNEIVADSYDKLLIATGTSANRTYVSGSYTANVHVLNQLSDARELKDIIKNSRSVAIIGGGYIGVEVAENLAHSGLNVTIVEAEGQILNVFDVEVAKLAQSELESMGVKISLREHLVAYETSSDKTIVVTDKDRYEVDLVIEAIGVRPNTVFLKDTGMNMLKNGAIVVNDKMETSIPDIYAAGDCVSYQHLIKGTPAYVPLGTHANKTGRIVAENIAGLDEHFAGIVGSNIIKVNRIGLAKTGLGIDEAKRLNLDYGYVDVSTYNQSHYFPGATKIFIRLVYEQGSGVLKGAQLVGEKGISDRINIMALAITKGVTAKELSQMDFAYSPPFNQVWDPLQVAANQIKL